jgi:hypothetical protein
VIFEKNFRSIELFAAPAARTLNGVQLAPVHAPQAREQLLLKIIVQ